MATVAEEGPDLKIGVRNSIQMSHVESELSLLPPRVCISRKLESGAGSSVWSQGIQCVASASSPLGWMPLPIFLKKEEVSCETILPITLKKILLLQLCSFSPFFFGPAQQSNSISSLSLTHLWLLSARTVSWSTGLWWENKDSRISVKIPAREKIKENNPS